MLSLYNNIEIRKRKGDSSARNEYCNKNIALIDACDISVCVQKPAILENKRELFDYSIFINDSKIRKADYRKFSFTCKKRAASSVIMRRCDARISGSENGARI